MAVETIQGPSKRIALLYRDDTTGAIASASVVASKLRADGLQRIYGSWHSDQQPATGFPRVRQSLDGSNWSIVQVIARDTAQADYQYPYDLKVKLPYVQVQWTQGGTGGTFLRASAFIEASSARDDSQLGLAAGSLQLLKSDKDTHYTGGLAAGNAELENLPGLLGNAGTVEGVAILSKDNVGWDLDIWSRSSQDDADLDVDTWLGRISFSSAEGVAVANATATTYRYGRSELKLPYIDDDGGNELHASLAPRGGAKAAGAAGEVKVLVWFRGS